MRARIAIEKARQLRITEIPFGTTTKGLAESIVAANEKGKIKVSKVEDYTAATADIVVTLPAGIDAENARDALFAFTDCEVSISPNACVIRDEKPAFIGVSEILKSCAFRTKDLLEIELQIRLGELQDKWHFSSLEKIFIENRIYRDIEECTTWEAVIEAIDKGLKPFKKLLRREVTRDDIIRLTEIKIKRISKYDAFRADEEIKGFEDSIEEVEKNLRNLTRYSVRYFENLKKKYGKGRERRTELVELASVNRSQVVAITETLYLDRKNGFAGWSLKKEEVIAKCSRMDDVLTILTDGKMQVSKIAEKAFVGKRPQHIAIFRKDEDKVYSIIYREGRDGATLAKRFRIGGVTRDKEYPLAKGGAGTRILYFAVHDTEEESAANTVLVHLKEQLRLRNLSRPFQFGDIAIKGRGVRGNVVTKHQVDRIVRAPKELE